MEDKKQLYGDYTLREPRSSLTETLYSLKSDWLNAQCEVSLSIQMLSDMLRGTRLTTPPPPFFFLQ